MKELGQNGASNKPDQMMVQLEKLRTIVIFCLKSSYLLCGLCGPQRVKNYIMPNKKNSLFHYNNHVFIELIKIQC